MGRNKSRPFEPEESTDEIFVELLIRIDGALDANKITTFRMPIRNRVQPGEAGMGAVELETAVLVRAIKEAVDKLV